MKSTSTYFSIDATSMMRGTSSENPADERFLLIDHIWSAYEVTGELTMKIGAKCVMAHFTMDMVLECQLASLYFDPEIVEIVQV